MDEEFYELREHRDAGRTRDVPSYNLLRPPFMQEPPRMSHKDSFRVHRRRNSFQDSIEDEDAYMPAAPLDSFGKRMHVMRSLRADVLQTRGCSTSRGTIVSNRLSRVGLDCLSPLILLDPSIMLRHCHLRLIIIVVHSRWGLSTTSVGIADVL